MMAQMRDIPMSASYSTVLVDAARSETQERRRKVLEQARSVAGSDDGLAKIAEESVRAMVDQFKANLRISKR